VTNRHVADEFAYRTGDSYEFHRNPEGRRMRASVNFRCEYQEDEESEHLVEKVLHIEDPNGPDVALLKLRKTSTVGDPLPEPIALADELLQLGQRVAVIGYPAVDGHRNDWAVMERIYRGIYGVKRLAPGEIMTIQPTHFTHDCTTLGGNSGSVVVNLATGRAVGLHFAGAYASANYAVPAPLLAERIKVLGLGQ
jgi:endonuclease G